MTDIISERVTAVIEGDFVVFLVGMRVNRIWKAHKWLPVYRAMGKMLEELARQPESGFLGAQSGGFFMVQYWRSFGHLDAYARSRDHLHWPSWVAFNRRVAANRGDVGIWHETYLIREGQYESIYSGMPRTGLGRVGSVVPATGRRESARQRVGEESAAAGRVP
jgi:fumigallin biosynthesis monooxygenase-like protein